SSTTGQPSPSAWPSPATCGWRWPTPTGCGAWRPAPSRPGGPVRNDPGGTRRSAGRKQVAQRPAHDFGLSRPGDVLEAEAEQQRRGGLDRGGGATAVAGRTRRVRRAPAGPVHPVAGRRPAHQLRIGPADHLGGGAVGGGVAARGESTAGEAPAETVERIQDAV